MRSAKFWSLLHVATIIIGLSNAKAQVPYGDFTGQVDIQFTDEEIRVHNEHIDKIVSAARDKMNDKLKEHGNFHDENGFSKFIGDAYWDSWDFDNLSKRRSKLNSTGHGNHVSKANELSHTSCVGFALEVLRHGFKSCGDEELTKVWTKIYDYTTKTYKSEGNALIHALRGLGWEVYYWNPNTSRTGGYINFTKSTSTYYAANRVDDYELLVNFIESPPEGFKSWPFFVGTANLASHVFVGEKGDVVEAHSLAVDPLGPESLRMIERNEFNPRKPGGAPKGKYFSGLIAIPPVLEQ